MKIVLLPRHFSGTIGRAHRVDLDHPHVADRLVHGAAVRLWVAGVEVSRPTPSRNTVVDEGEGRCIVDGTKLWISIPGNPDPRAANLDLVVDVPLTTDRELFSTARPLLILGPQRCGSTALQWALDNCTAYKAPRDLRGFLDNTLEGFYLTQLLKSLLNHPHWSPLGSDASSHFWGTGLLQDCGFSAEMFAGLARHIDAAYSNSSGTQGTWTDKCPGWDSVIIAPLFRALFPRGHVFFISREPVSNVLSIMRLRGELSGDMPEERRVGAVAQASAVWTIAHYLWRRYVRPIMPQGSATEIDFAKFRARRGGAGGDRRCGGVERGGASGRRSRPRRCPRAKSFDRARSAGAVACADDLAVVRARGGAVGIRGGRVQRVGGDGRVASVERREVGVPVNGLPLPRVAGTEHGCGERGRDAICSGVAAGRAAAGSRFPWGGLAACHRAGGCGELIGPFMNHSSSTILTLTARHFSQPRGKAYPVTVRHPALTRRMTAGMRVQIWDSSTWRGVAADSVEDVAMHGGGRCFVEVRPIWLEYPFDCDPGTKGVSHPLTTIWLSLPDDSDPRKREEGLIVELSAPGAARPTPEKSATGPLLIIGPQRSGTTALQLALHLATRYRAPCDVNRYPANTLEGFHVAQAAHCFVGHRFLSCFGSDSRHLSLRTGVFDDSGMADWMIDSLAEHLSRTYCLAACTDGTWTDKCPGWEATALGPLYAALFPGARIIFMSRDPVSCVLSIARLEATLPRSLDDEGAVVSIARNAAVWIISHLLWRRYGRPRLPSHAFLEVPFEAFRDHPEQVAPRIGDHLALTAPERREFLAALRRVRLPRNPIDHSAMDPRIPALIQRLCRDEAMRSSHEVVGDLTLDGAVVDNACRLLRAHLDRMLDWHSIRPDVARSIADRVIEAALHHDAHLRDEPPLPDPGPLLSTRIAMHGGLPETPVG